MFTVWAKDFMAGTVVQRNLSVVEVNQLFLNWCDGKDIVVNNIIIPNKNIETISVKETQI